MTAKKESVLRLLEQALLLQQQLNTARPRDAELSLGLTQLQLHLHTWLQTDSIVDAVGMQHYAVTLAECIDPPAHKSVRHFLPC
jgi:hypothetical protein